MNAMTDYRTWATAQPKLPPSPKRAAPVGFTMEQLMADAKAIKAAQQKTWNGGDRINYNKFASDPATVAARRAVWLAALPEGQFARQAARDCWDIHDAAADHRIDILERVGLIKRVKFKPIEWVRA